jgi:hypothetical protein
MWLQSHNDLHPFFAMQLKNNFLQTLKRYPMKTMIEKKLTGITRRLRLLIYLYRIA